MSTCEDEIEFILDSTDSNIRLWQTEMIAIRCQLVEHGSQLCKSKIVSLVNESTLFDNVESYYEAISCFSNKKVFEAKPHSFLSLLHKSQVGIFTQPNDNWARISADDWLKARNAEYVHEPKKCNEREKKGFVLSLLKHKASPEVKDDLASMTAHSLGLHLMGKLQLNF